MKVQTSKLYSMWPKCVKKIFVAKNYSHLLSLKKNFRNQRKIKLHLKTPQLFILKHLSNDSTHFNNLR